MIIIFGLKKYDWTETNIHVWNAINIVIQNLTISYNIHIVVPLCTCLSKLTMIYYITIGDGARLVFDLPLCGLAGFSDVDDLITFSFNTTLGRAPVLYWLGRWVFPFWLDGIFIIVFVDRIDVPVMARAGGCGFKLGTDNSIKLSLIPSKWCVLFTTSGTCDDAVRILFMRGDVGWDLATFAQFAIILSTLSTAVIPTKCPTFDFCFGSTLRTMFLRSTTFAYIEYYTRSDIHNYYTLL